MSSFLINPYAFAKLWTPAQISTARWFDAADSSTITITSGRISQWSDKSGNAANATNAIAAERPKVTASSLNSLDVVEFDPTGTEFQRLTFSELSNYEHLFFVAQKNDVDEYNVVLSSTSIDIRSVIIGVGTGSNFAVQQITPINSGYTRNAWHIGEARTDGTTATMGVDGIRISAADADKLISAHIGYYNNSNISPSFNASANSLRGKVAEIIMCSLALTDANRERVEGYLAHKWGLRANLPAGHPYKTTPPYI